MDTQRCKGLLAAMFVVAGATVPLWAQSDVPPCRHSDVAPVRWVEEEDESDREALAMWCNAVGPPAVRVGAEAVSAPLDSLLFLSWNVFIGGGDLYEVLGQLRSGNFTGGHPVEHFVAFVQEAQRAGPDVPVEFPEVYLPRRKTPAPPSGVRRDIVECAEAYDLYLFYVPSMRNGRGKEGEVEEDRGSAILSTLPLHDLTAIEMPFEKYRRVNVAATIRVETRDGNVHDLRVCCAHLSNRTRFPRFFTSMGVGRLRQARALVERLPERPAVLGGDFNTWALSHIERALPELRKHFPLPRHLDDEKTNVAPFLPDRRVDYILYAVPEEWQPGYRRLDERYGSDHYPLLGWLRFGKR